MKVKNQYLKILEYLHLSFNKWPSIQYKIWVSLVLETTIKGKTADLAMNQKTNIDTLHKEGKSQRVITEKCGVYRVLYQSILMQSWLEGRIWVGKGAQATGMTASLRIRQAKLIQHLGELHKEWTEAGVSASRVHHAQSLQEKGLPSQFETRDNVRSILPGLWRKRTGLLLSGPSPLFRWK